MVRLDKCSGSCNSGHELFIKIYVPSKTKHLYVKAFNTITRINKAKTLLKHISYDWIWEFNSTPCNSNQKWNNETYQRDCKNYCTSKKDYRWNPNTCICENSKYLKSIPDTSVIACDRIMHAVDVVSAKRTNTIATNVSINCHSKKVKYKIDCYILQTVLLVITLLLIIIGGIRYLVFLGSERYDAICNRIRKWSLKNHITFIF